MNKFTFCVDIHFKRLYNIHMRKDKEVFELFKVSLEAARVNAKLSQKDVATRLKVNVGTVSNWERGKTAPDADKFKELCNLYNCPVDVIILPKKFT